MPIELFFLGGGFVTFIGIVFFIVAKGDPTKGKLRLIGGPIIGIGIGMICASLYFGVQMKQRQRSAAVKTPETATIPASLADQEYYKYLALWKDKDKSNDKEAYEAFKSRGQEMIEPMVEVLVADDAASARDYARDLLAEFGEPAVKPLIEVLENPFGRFYVNQLPAALGQIGAPSVAPLIEYISNTDVDIEKKLLAIKALGLTKEKMCTDTLLSELKKAETSREKIVIVHALGTIGDLKAKDELLNMAQSEESEVKLTAIEALGNTFDTSVEKELLELLKHDDTGIRKSAASALGIAKSQKAVKPLIQLLRDESDNVRLAAAYALGLIGDKSAIQPILKALDKEETHGVRSMMKNAVTTLTEADKAKKGASNKKGKV